MGAAHETLLKASMPVNREVGLTDPTKHRAVPVKKATTKRRTATPVQQSRVAMPQMRRAERWMVLTSWDGTGRPENGASP